MDAEEKIEMVLEWADEKDRDFDTEFVESLQEFFDDNGHLTTAQMKALDNIIDRWGVK